MGSCASFPQFFFQILYLQTIRETMRDCNVTDSYGIRRIMGYYSLYFSNIIFPLFSFLDFLKNMILYGTLSFIWSISSVTFVRSAIILCSMAASMALWPAKRAWIDRRSMKGIPDSSSFRLYNEQLWFLSNFLQIQSCLLFRQKARSNQSFLLSGPYSLQEKFWAWWYHHCFSAE